MDSKFRVILSKGTTLTKTKIEIRNTTTGEIVSCEVEKLPYEGWVWEDKEKGYVMEMQYEVLLSWLSSDSKLKSCCEIVEKWITGTGGEGGFF